MKHGQLRSEIRARGYELAEIICGGPPVKSRAGEAIFHSPYRADANPSLRVVIDKTGANPGDWRDDAADEGGDVFDLYARTHDLDPKRDFARILRETATLLGLRSDAEAAPKGRRYTPAPDPDWKDFAARYALPEDAWAKAGFQVVTRRSKAGGNIRYPITRPDGIVNGHKVRTLARDAKGKRNAWADPAGLGSDGLVIPQSSPPSAGQVLVLTAGEEKALAAVHAGFAAVALPYGEKAPSPPTIAQIAALSAREIVVAYDAKEPNAMPCAQALAAAGIQTSIALWHDAPKGRDLNDALRDGGIQAIKDLIDNADPVEAPPRVEAVNVAPDRDFLEAYNPPPFPLDALPPVVRGIVHNSAWISATDPGMAAMYALGALSAALNGKVVVRMPNFFEPCNLYNLVVAKSSERKSAVMSPIMEPIHAAGKREAAAIAERRHERETDVLLLNKEKTRIANSKHPSNADRQRLNEILSELESLEKEARPSLAISTDTTMEALAIAMESHGGTWSIISGEAGIFDIIAGSRYSKTATANLDLFLSAYSAERFAEQRVGRKGVHLPDPALTVCLAAQPAVLARIQRDSDVLGGRGFLHRFLYWICPYKFRDETHDRIPDQSARDEWGRMISTLLSIPRAEEKRDRLVNLSPGAFEAWRPHERAHERATRFEGIASSENFLDAWRGPGSILRIAALLHFAKHYRQPLCSGLHGAFSTAIFPDTLEEAATIVAACRTHARVAYNTMGLRGTLPEDMPRVVLAALQAMRKDNVSLTATHLADRLRRFDSATVHAAISVLKAKHVVNVEKFHSGGRPTERYVVNLPDQKGQPQ